VPRRRRLLSPPWAPQCHRLPLATDQHPLRLTELHFSFTLHLDVRASAIHLRYDAPSSTSSMEPPWAPPRRLAPSDCKPLRCQLLDLDVGAALLSDPRALLHDGLRGLAPLVPRHRPVPPWITPFGELLTSFSPPASSPSLPQALGATPIGTSPPAATTIDRPPPPIDAMGTPLFLAVG
jgi:hypothetical protein